MANFALYAAAGLLVATAFAHSWLGERKLIGPLLAPGRRAGVLETSAFARSVLRFGWHLTSLAWVGLAAVLAALASGKGMALAVSVTAFLTGAVIAGASRGRHLAWPVFVAVGALALL